MAKLRFLNVTFFRIEILRIQLSSIVPQPVAIDVDPEALRILLQLSSVVHTVVLFSLGVSDIEHISVLTEGYDCRTIGKLGVSRCIPIHIHGQCPCLVLLHQLRRIRQWLRETATWRRTSTVETHGKRMGASILVVKLQHLSVASLPWKFHGDRKPLSLKPGLDNGWKGTGTMKSVPSA